MSNSILNEEKKIIWEDCNFDIPFSKPTKLIFRQNEIIFNHSWRTLYRELILCLFKDHKYREILQQYKDVKFFGARRSLFNSYQMAKEELKGVSLYINDEYDYIKNDLYLYNKLSARSILSRIAKILNILSINTTEVEIYYIDKDKDTSFVVPDVVDDYEEIITQYDYYIDNIKEVLIENFDKGFRLNDTIEFKKFNNIYNEKYNECIVPEDKSDEFYKFLINKFIVIDGKIYAKEVLITDNIQSKIDEFISDIRFNDILISKIDKKEYILTLDFFMNTTNLNSCISREKIKKCIEKGLLDNDNLNISILYQKGEIVYLMIKFTNREIDSNHRTILRFIKSDFRELRDSIDDVISNYLKLEGTCVSYKEICEKLKYINETDIKKVVLSRYISGKSNSVIYDSTGFNTSLERKKFFYISSFPLAESECKAINDLLIEKANEGWQPIDLKKCIEKNFTSFSYKLNGDDFHNDAIKRCIDILLNINNGFGNINDDYETEEDDDIDDERE